MLRRKWLYIVGAVGFLILIWVLLEIGASIWLHSRFFDVMVFRATRPAAYANSTYFSPEFIKEQKEFRQIPTDGKDQGTYHGKYYNMVNGIRRTVGSRDVSKHSIYMFGSSTMLASEVPDEYTIASQLQQMLPAYKVVNMGVSAAAASELLEKVQQVSLHSGDIVVFYTGYIDAGSIVYTAGNRSAEQSICGKIPDYLSVVKRSYVIRLVCDLQIEKSTNAIFNSTYIEEQTTDLIKRYSRSIAEARNYVIEHGAQFYNFIQPTIWSKDLSPYEISVASRSAQEAAAFSVAYPRLIAADKDSVSLWHALDAIRRSGVEVYLDPAHVTEQANGVIAHVIYDTLFLVF